MTSTDLSITHPPVDQPVSLVRTEPREYPHFLRTPQLTGPTPARPARWWRGALAILSLVVGYLLLGTGLTIAAMAIDAATGRGSWEAYARGEIVVTPMLFFANNLSLAALIPLAMLLQWSFFGLRPRWLSSVEGRFRWRWFGSAAKIILPVWVGYVVVLYLLEPDQLGPLSADAAVMLAVVVITTPFQAAGEEYGVRGLIARSVGSWSGSPKAALLLSLVLSTVFFTLAHAATDPWLLVYYFVFGAALGVLAWRTGGLEVPVLVHVTNNLLILVPAALFGDLSRAFDRGPGTGGPILLVPMVLLVLVVAVVEWWTRRNKIIRRGSPSEVSDV